MLNQDIEDSLKKMASQVKRYMINHKELYAEAAIFGKHLGDLVLQMSRPTVKSLTAATMVFEGLNDYSEFFCERLRSMNTLIPVAKQMIQAQFDAEGIPSIEEVQAKVASVMVGDMLENADAESKPN